MLIQTVEPFKSLPTTTIWLAVTFGARWHCSTDWPIWVRYGLESAVNNQSPCLHKEKWRWRWKKKYRINTSSSWNWNWTSSTLTQLPSASRRLCQQKGEGVVRPGGGATAAVSPKNGQHPYRYQGCEMRCSIHKRRTASAASLCGGSPLRRGFY